MGLRIVNGRDGKPRGTWYGRISVKGSMRETNLNVPIAGTIPTDEAGNVLLSKTGDEAFERSRMAAQKAFDAWRKATKTDPAELERKAYKARTGISLDGTPLSHLAAAWRGITRTYTPTEHKLKLYDATLSAPNGTRRIQTKSPSGARRSMMSRPKWQRRGLTKSAPSTHGKQ